MIFLVDWLAPPMVEPSAVVVMLAASAVASFITIAFGIGGGVLLIAVMATLVPPAALIPVHGIVQFGSNVGRIFLMFSFISWRDTRTFMLGSLLGVMAGGSVAPNLSPALVQMGVGLFVIWSVFLKPPLWLTRFPIGTGAVSSFLTMFFGATGPFVATFTKSLALDRHRHVATHGAMMSVQHLLKTLMLGFLGFNFTPWVGFTIAMIGCGALGTFAGRLVLDRISDKRFRLALDIILVVLALRLIWAGFWLF
ncbi:MAG: sulfite exporter TauE/SafE family protein [Allorhizobium sp.]